MKSVCAACLEMILSQACVRWRANRTKWAVTSRHICVHNMVCCVFRLFFSLSSDLHYIHIYFCKSPEQFIVHFLLPLSFDQIFRGCCIAIMLNHPGEVMGLLH